MIDKKQIQKHIKEIEGNIAMYSKQLPLTVFARTTRERKFNERDFEIVRDVQNILQSICQDWIDEIIDDKEISEWAGKIMYEKYNPSILQALLNDDVFDFIMLLDDYYFYKTGENQANIELDN